MAKVLCTRVSSISQNLDRQIQDADCYDKVFEDKCSKKDTLLQALFEKMGYVWQGDEAWVHELSRLVRITFDLIDLVNKMLDKRVCFHSIK